MKSVVFETNNDLNNIFLDYYLYLINNNIESQKSFDYIFSVLDYLNISSKYLKTLTFDNSISSVGIYLPEDKTIKMNINKIKGCYHLHYIDRSQMILSFFSILIHEITHVYQTFYKDNYDNDISKILRISENFKFLSNNDYTLYSLFPDEVHANFNSAVYLFKLGHKKQLKEKLLYLEKQLIYFITLGIISDNRIINSQIKYLYILLLNEDYEEKYHELDRIDHLYLGLTKSSEDMNCLIKSYQTQKLCLDI